jgi:hypothetical protein
MRAPGQSRQTVQTMCILCTESVWVTLKGLRYSIEDGMYDGQTELGPSPGSLYDLAWEPLAVPTAILQESRSRHPAPRRPEAEIVDSAAAEGLWWAF